MSKLQHKGRFFKKRRGSMCSCTSHPQPLHLGSMCCKIPCTDQCFSAHVICLLTHTHLRIYTMTQWVVSAAFHSRCSQCRSDPRRPPYLKKFLPDNHFSEKHPLISSIFTFLPWFVCLYLTIWPHPLLCTQALHCHHLYVVSFNCCQCQYWM